MKKNILNRKLSKFIVFRCLKWLKINIKNIVSINGKKVSRVNNESDNCITGDCSRPNIDFSVGCDYKESTVEIKYFAKIIFDFFLRLLLGKIYFILA